MTYNPDMQFRAHLARVALVGAVCLIGCGCAGVDAPASANAGPSAKHASARQPEVPAPPARPISIVWVGDITPGSRYGLPPAHGRTMLRSVRSLLNGDIVWGNLEGTFSTGGPDKCGSGSANCYSFQAPPAYVAALTGFDGVNLANNHAGDFGSSGLAQTRATLAKRHILASGLDGRIVYLRRGGLRVAVVGFASYPWSSDITDIAAAKRLVRRADRNADLVLVFFHGGAEGSDQVHVPHATEYAYGENRGNLRALSHALIDGGADLVAGSGPHVLRGVERYRGRIVAYSLGNFAGNGNFSTGGNLSLSGILSVRLNPDGTLAGGAFHPARLDSHPWPISDPHGAALDLVRRVSREDFGTASAIGARGRLHG
jgi:hypothetical protein